MKGKLVNLLLTVAFLAGLGFLLYPTVSDYYNSWLQSQIIIDYSQQVDQMEDKLFRENWEAAEAYNASLLNRPTQFALTEEQETKYWKMLSTTGAGVMAYVEIPSISVTLPIAHGTEKDTLNNYVGHIKWSSLPIGGESTHCVVSGHRGLPSSELFTNIDHLELGDSFFIHVMGQTHEYRVDNIAVVDPYDYALLTIQKGKDYTTLVTCTPYGINSHRLLVRGVRVDGTETDTDFEIRNELSQVDLMVIVPAVLVTVSAAVFVFLLIDSSRNKRNHKGGEKDAKN